MSDQVLGTLLFAGLPLTLMVIEALLFTRARRYSEALIVEWCGAALVIAVVVDYTPLAAANDGYNLVALGVLAAWFLAPVAAFGVGLIELGRWTLNTPLDARRLWAWAPIGALAALIVVLGKTLH